MKNFYKYMLSVTMLLSTIVLGASQKLTDVHLARLAEERVTNLVIINDAHEYLPYPDLLISQMVNTQEVLIIPAMHADLIKILSSNQLVLCPRLLWHSVQNIVATFDKLISINLDLYPIGSDIPLYGLQCRMAKELYDKINIMHASSDDNKNAEIKKLIHQMRDVLTDKKIAAKTRFNIQEMFSVYMHHFNIIRHGYVCKRVTKKRTDVDEPENDFLLFVPKSFHRISRNVAVQDAWLGLSWTELPNYDYQRAMSYHDIQKIKNANQVIEISNRQGEQLLKALNILKFENNHVPRELRPFFNVYLSGHGSKNSVTAEISIVSKKNSDGSTSSSDFVKILNFFNTHVRTQSLAIISCYPGGQKLINTYNIDNYYSNVQLEKLSYLLINVGSTFQQTISTLISTGLIFEKTIYFSSLGLYLPQSSSLVKKYFACLNPSILDYQKAVKILSEGVADSQDITDIQRPQNYVSIKFPHVPWFSAVQFPIFVKQLSQVAMATADQPIAISKDIKVLLLSANYIPQPIYFQDSSKLPKLLPVNYSNQNYYFDFVAINAEVEQWGLIFPQLFVSEIEEPVCIVFKQLIFNNRMLSDMVIFMHQNLHQDGKFLSGYMYTSALGQTKIVFWPSNEKIPASIIENLDIKGMSKHFADHVVKKVHKTLPPALKKEFLAKLNHALAAKTSPKNIDDANARWFKDSQTGKWKELPSAA